MPLSDEIGGRPPVQIDWEELDKLCGLQCTGAECAAYLGVSYDALSAACHREHGKSFPQYFEEKRAPGKIALRRRQYQAAMKGNSTMLVWLGKNWLDQTDHVEVSGGMEFSGFRVVADEGTDGDSRSEGE